PYFGRPAARRAHFIIRIKLRLVDEHADLAAHDFLQVHKRLSRAVAVFHADDVGLFHQLGKRGDGNGELVIVRVVIDQDVQVGKEIGDVVIELDRVLHVQRLVIRNAQEHAVGAEILDEVHFLHHFARVGAGDADEKRHALFHGFHRGDGEGFEFVEKQAVAFAVGAGGGDVLNAVLDDLVDALSQVIHGDGLRGADVGGIGRGEGGHHPEDSL